MPDAKPGYLAADSYTVSKQLKNLNVGYIPIAFKDNSGNVVLTAKKGGIGRHAVLTDPKGKEVGYIQKKGITLGLKSTYLFFEGQSNQIGQVVIRSGLTGLSETMQLQDPKGGLVATATGNFMGFSFEIYSADGSKTLARISRDAKTPQEEGGKLTGLLKAAASTAMSLTMGSYRIEILEKSINDMSRLFILELVVVLDGMYQTRSSMANPGFGAGMGGI